MNRLDVLIVLVVVYVLSACASQVAWGQAPRVTQSPPRSVSKMRPPSVKSFPGPVIPGLRQKAVPQGLAYAVTEDKILISHYFDDGPSCVSILNGSTGKMFSCVTLKEPSGEFHRGHVGGIAISKEKLFVSSGGQVLQYKLGTFLSRRPPMSTTAIAMRKCETTAAFCTSTEEFLFVGDYAYGKDYPTHASHHLKDRKGVRKYAWVCGYDSANPLGAPKCVLSVRQKVQGMYVSENRVYLSLSFGRKNRSTIVVYKNPIGEAAHKTVQIRGDSVPLWFLDGENYLGEIDFPPMSEGITMIKNKLAVLSESGASKYKIGSKGPLDRIIYLDVSRFE